MLRIWAILVIFITATSLTSFLTIHAEESQIPSWIKNNAGWWANDEIGEDEFLHAITFLQKNGILKIPVQQNNTTTELETNEENRVPTWIKSNAKWWAQNLISDEEFISGLYFLADNGILDVSNDLTKPISNSEVLGQIFQERTLESDFVYDEDVPIPFLMNMTNTADQNVPLEHETQRECRNRLIAQGASGIEINKCNRIDRTYMMSAMDCYNLAKKKYGELTPRAFKECNAEHNADKNINYYPSDIEKFSYDPTEHYYDYYYPGYGAPSQMDVQHYLSRADYYAKKWIVSITPMAQQWASGKISYNEYEQRGMSFFNYYSNQFEREIDDYFTSKFGYP